MRVRGYRYQPTINGKRQSFWFDTKEERREFKAKLALGLVGPQSLTSENPTFKTCAEKWLREYSKVEKGFNSHDEDSLIVGRYLLSAPYSGTRVKDITKADLMTFKAELLRTNARGKSKPLNPKTVNHVLTVCRSIMNYAVDLGYIRDNPWIKVKPAKTKDSGFRVRYQLSRILNKFRQRPEHQYFDPFYRFPYDSLVSPKIPPSAHHDAHLPRLGGLKSYSIESSLSKDRYLHRYRIICSRYGKNLLAREQKPVEPHFEVAADPFDRQGYIARLTAPNGISVSEPIPKDIYEDENRDLTLYWPVVRKRLGGRLLRIQKSGF